MRKMMRRLIPTVLAACLLSAGAVRAQTGTTGSDYPNRPIRLIAPFAAGGSTDMLARTIAPELSKRLGQNVVVENRPGAGGVIGTEMIARAVPDGYTIGIGSPGPLVVNVSLMNAMPYDPVRDVTPVSLIADLPIVLVAHPSLSVNNIRELIAAEKAKPGTLSFASAGAGTTMHLAGELLNVMAGTRLVHVPYKGTGPAMTDILGGQVALGFLDIPSTAAHVKAGKIKVLAIGNARRSITAPDIPTIDESGVPGYETTGWFGIIAPAGTPAAVVNRLHAELVTVMKDASVREKLLGAGIEPMATTPEAFGAFIRSEIPKWAKVVQHAGMPKR